MFYLLRSDLSVCGWWVWLASPTSSLRTRDHCATRLLKGHHPLQRVSVIDFSHMGVINRSAVKAAFMFIYSQNSESKLSPNQIAALSSEGRSDLEASTSISRFSLISRRHCGQVGRVPPTVPQLLRVPTRRRLHGLNASLTSLAR